MNIEKQSISSKIGKKWFIIEGNIGTGKSTFLKKLNEDLDCEIIYEPLEQWIETKDEDNKNILDHFYKDTIISLYKDGANGAKCDTACHLIQDMNKCSLDNCDFDGVNCEYYASINDCNTFNETSEWDKCEDLCHCKLIYENYQIQDQLYCYNCSSELYDKFISNDVNSGITITCGGFYGSHGRSIRLSTSNKNKLSEIKKIKYKNNNATNLEMETAIIYAMSKLLGHKAMSLNAILANRNLGEYSLRPKKTVESLIEYVLTKL